MAQPHTRSPVVGGKPDWESQPGRGTWNLTAIPRRMERSAKGIAGWILAKVNGMGPQASLQQEASQGQHAHRRGSSCPPLPISLANSNVGTSIKSRSSGRSASLVVGLFLCGSCIGGVGGFQAQICKW